MGALVLVPKIATNAMVAAAEAASAGTYRQIWSAMVNAALATPNPSVGEETIDGLRAMRVRLSVPQGCDLPAQTISALPAIGTMHRNPDFWSDLEVRRLAVELHRQVTIKKALEIITAQLGAERCPSKSALARAWKRLDIHKKGNRKGRN